MGVAVQQATAMVFAAEYNSFNNGTRDSSLFWKWI
eukprot:COSAG02_NODE_8131_length_2695_cov_20.340909_3_plen_35_part_01